MQNLLQEFYKTDIQLDKFHFRKIFLEQDVSYQINGISQSGKTSLVKNYLLELKKSSYLYIDCNDIRIDIDILNQELFKFCNINKIDTLVLDNYNQYIKLVNVSQLIICSELYIDNEQISSLKHLDLYPLDYEEFLAYEHKYDSTALNHFFQLGGFPAMHKINNDIRISYIQKTLKLALDEMEFDILVLCAKMFALKLSAFAIYERLKQSRKISKDKLYKSFDSLNNKNYIFELKKFESKKATKKIYLCDTSLRLALTTDKHFSRRFENMIFLELLKAHKTCFYDDGIDFYLPSNNEVILGMPFADERSLFKKIETIEAFIFTHDIQKITAVTMSKEASISHPLSEIEMIPFDIWALGD